MSDYTLSTIKLNIPSEAVRAEFIAHIETLEEMCFVVPHGGAAVVMQYPSHLCGVVYTDKVKPELRIVAGSDNSVVLEDLTIADIDMLCTKYPLQANYIEIDPKWYGGGEI